MTLGSRVEVTIPTLRKSSGHSSGIMSPVSALSSFACAIVFDWSPIHKLTGLDVEETRWDNATWYNTTPHSYTDGQRRTNYYWEFIHINSENLFVEQLLRNTNHCGYGSGTPPRKLSDRKGVQMKVIWKSADQTEKQGICLHVACILLVGVLGQNVTGQNVTDTMSWTKYYEDKMLLAKMSRHFVHDIFSTTYFQRHFVQWQFVNITFCPRYFVHWHLVRPPL